MGVRIERLRYDKLNARYKPTVKKYRLWTFIAGMIFLSLWLFLSEAIGATAPADYALNLDVEVANGTSEDLNMLVPVSIDSALLSNFDLIDVGFKDILFADRNDVITKGFVQDISFASSTWFMLSTAPAGETQIEQLYMTGPEAEHGFPSSLPNATKLEAPSSASLQITDDLVASTTIDSTSCGTVQAKHDLDFGNDASGWGVYFLGNMDFPEHDPSTFSFFNNSLYYDITPINDVIVCGVALGATQKNSTRVRFHEAVADITVHDTVITYYPQFLEVTEGLYGLLEQPFLMTGGIQYRVFLDFAGSSGNFSTALDLDVTTDIARYHHDNPNINFDGDNYNQLYFDSDASFTGDTSSAGMMFMNADITASTSTTLDISNSGILDASVNCTSLVGTGNDLRWNGNEITLSFDYSTTSGAMTLAANGFPITVTLPTCEVFGKKQGNKLSPPVTSWEFPLLDRFMATSFTLAATSSVATINVGLQEDAGLDSRTNVEMQFTSRMAIYDSSRNFIVAPPAVVQQITGVSNPFIISSSFAVPIPLSPGDYFLAYWAGDVEQTLPINIRIDGNEELEVSDINGVSNQLQALYSCFVDFQGISSTSDQNHWLTIESVDVYLDHVNGSRLLRAAAYNSDAPLTLVDVDYQDFVQETNEIVPVQGWNTLTFTPPVLLHSGTDTLSWLPPFNVTNRLSIVFWSDETLHDVQYSLVHNEQAPQLLFPPLGFPNLANLGTCVSIQTGTYPTWPDPIPSLTADWPNPTLGDDQELLWFVRMGEVISYDIHAQSAGSAKTIEVDDVDYTGNFGADADPFVNDSPISNSSLNIWGDLIPISPSLISTSAVQYIAGSGLTGKMDNLSVSGTSGLALFTPFNPTNNSLSQIGDSGNDWTWLGQIQDGSMQNNDLTYTILSDQTGVTSALIPLGANATPLVFIAPELPDIVGNPELDVFTDPGTITPSVIMQKLRDVSTNGDFPATMFWLMLGSLVLVAISSVAMKVIAYDMVPWGISLVGFYLISVIAGPDFLILWVALNALYATGVLLIMNFSR